MRTPASTYRMQISADFDLHDAARVLPYVWELGADWVYLSPLLEAHPGSDHGYDVVRHDRIDPARGGTEGLAAVSKAAKELGMGVLVDIVPNHVGVETPEVNGWWWDVLTHGERSAYASAFDIDWVAGGGKVLVPVVGDDDQGSIEVDPGARDGAGEVRYHEHRFPLAPGTSTLAEQHYELAPWREADTRLNYRRFFGVNTLAAVRVEDDHWFTESHAEIRRWFAEGLVDGLRVDHPDGLRDPGKYLRDLQELTGGAYVLVEKILEPGEQLPESWETAGTTGYDVLGLIDRVLTDPDGADQLPFADLDWKAMVHDSKRAVADGMLGSETARIVRELPDLSTSGRPGTSAAELTDAVAEVLACMGVYRSYLPEGREHLDRAMELAHWHKPQLATTFDVLAPVLADPAQPAALRFQQTSGMVMAKGVEDCAFYRYPRLTSLTEVGGDPSEFSLSPRDFHSAMLHRHQEWPAAMIATSTHDTKRAEDVRARITVLAEMPAQWRQALDHLQRLAPIPDPAYADLLWQAVVGAWPEVEDPSWRERLHAYAEKSMREAGARTTWTDPDEEFESAVHAAVDAVFEVPDVRSVLDAVLGVIHDPGWSNALSAKALALTLPGVPDVYQGSELREQSLVDPDNRRAVDFEHREGMLGGRRTGPGIEKIRLVNTALTLRRDKPELFGDYVQLTVTGEAAEHAVAYDRGGVIVLVTRLPLGLADRGGWGDTAIHLPPGRWDTLLSGEISEGVTSVQSLLHTYPVALLVREDYDAESEALV